jgi:hypothetical protein
VGKADEQEKYWEQIDQLTRELATAREQLKAMETVEKARRAQAEGFAWEAAEQKKQSEQNEFLVRELASAREQLQISRAAEAAVKVQVEQARAALVGKSDERKKQSEENDRLTRELATAREQLKATRAAENALRAQAGRLAGKPAQQKKQSEQNEILAGEPAPAREQLKASQAAKNGTRLPAQGEVTAAGNKQSRADRANELAPGVRPSRAKRSAFLPAAKPIKREQNLNDQKPLARAAALRRQVADGAGAGGGPVEGTGSAISVAAVADAAGSLHPAERALLVQRCASMLAKPAKHDRELVAVCRAVTAR